MASMVELLWLNGSFAPPFRPFGPCQRLHKNGPSGCLASQPQRMANFGWKWGSYFKLVRIRSLVGNANNLI